MSDQSLNDTATDLVIPDHSDGPFRRAVGAAGWGVTVAALAAVSWLGELALLRLLPDPVRLGPFLRGSELAFAAPFAVLAGGIGFLVGCASGLISGAPPRATTAVVRGLGFSVVAAVGGGIFPLVALITVGWISPDLSSALSWALVAGVAAVVAHSWSRAPVAFSALGADDQPARRQRIGAVRLPGAAAPEPAEFVEPTRLSSAYADTPVEEPPPAVAAGPRANPAVATRSLPPSTVAAASAEPAGAAVRLAPVLMVSATCLLAVGLSAPSPVGWAMLAIGLLGLAVTWALLGQERRIRELERRLTADERPAPEA